MSGYSKTPLVKKLGMKEGQVVKFVNHPSHYFDLLENIPEVIDHNESPNESIDFIHFFTSKSLELENQLPVFKEELAQNGMIWVSWPKKASGVSSEVDENLIRDTALKLGLVDTKVCAVDEVWSGLKLMIRIKNRK